MVVLVGEGTASAAEIFAGAIQDHDVGLIVGTQTWGKGLVQTVYSLSYGAGLALTTARYYTPSGRLIQRDYSSWFDYSTHSNGVNPADLESEGSENVVGLEAYRTDLGRKVYGGGGISPDVIIEFQEIPSLLQILLSRNAFFDFAVSYANRHPIESRDWQVPDPVLEEFYRWVVEEELITSEELTEQTADAAVAEEVRRNLRGELLNSAFGIEARYEVIAEGDPQILEALTLFDDAKSLLARRQLLLDDDSQPEKTASLPE
jgi:carboxyl-terminal processing protease